MIDLPDRTQARFPAAREQAVRQRMAQQLDDWGMAPGDLALCGGARGADILFAELAIERGATVWLHLAFEPREFIRRSVRMAHTNWEKRFRGLLEKCTVLVQKEQPGTGDRFSRNNRWLFDTACHYAATPEDIRLLLVWDEQPDGDGPGGTADMAALGSGIGPQYVAVVNPTLV